MWRISKPIGGYMSRTPPIFIDTEETIWIPYGNMTCNFSLHTALLQFSYTHKSTVLSLNYLEPQQRVASICRGGMINHWGIAEKKIVFTANLNKNIWKASYSPYTNAYYFLCKKEGNKIINGVKNSKTLEELPDITLPDVHGTCTQFAISISGKILALIIGKSLLYTPLDKKGVVKVDHDIPLVSLAISPDDTMIVSGDLAGKISYWHIASGTPTKSTYHWHAHPVECLTFNSDGTILYTGGHEGVLVLWHTSTNTRTFVPRFSGQLITLGVSSNGTHIAIGLKNNSVKVINTATLKERVTISQLNFEPDCAVAAQDPLSKRIAISSSSGNLQFYDIKAKRVVYNLDVSFKNYTSKTFNETINPLIITHIAFSLEGEDLLTIEQTSKTPKDSLIQYEVTLLKFWKRTATGELSMTAIIENPHHSKRINHCVFASNYNLPAFATAGDDNRFMVWEYNQNWMCTTIGSYKEMPILQLKYASSQLCALHVKNLVTLWQSNAMIKALTIPIKSEIFDCSLSTDKRHILSLTQTSISSYNLKTDTLIWELKLSSIKVYNDPSMDSQCCITFSEDNSYLLIMNYEQSAPFTILKFKGNMEIANIIYADLGYEQNSILAFKSNGQMQKLSYIHKNEVIEMEEEETKETIGTKIYSADSMKLPIEMGKKDSENVIRKQLLKFNGYLNTFKSYEVPSNEEMLEELFKAVLIKRDLIEVEESTEIVGEEEYEKMEVDENELQSEDVIDDKDLQGLSILL